MVSKLPRKQKEPFHHSEETHSLVPCSYVTLEKAHIMVTKALHLTKVCAKLVSKIRKSLKQLQQRDFSSRLGAGLPL